ncbi:hypothetical protein STEG23_005979, partial [Scotinomys teguina]
AATNQMRVKTSWEQGPGRGCVRMKKQDYRHIPMPIQHGLEHDFYLLNARIK